MTTRQINKLKHEDIVFHTYRKTFYSYVKPRDFCRGKPYRFIFKDLDTQIEIVLDKRELECCKVVTDDKAFKVLYGKEI